MLWVVNIKIINVQKQLESLHGVLLCYYWADFVKIANWWLEKVYYPREI